VTFTAVVAMLGVVAIAASYFPARRASRIPPVEALRAQ
jgi:ABC-type lipoprotein release transport system permease subunit